MIPRRCSLILAGALLGFLDCRPKDPADEMTDMQVPVDGSPVTSVKKFTLIDDFDAAMVADGATFSSPGTWKTDMACSYTYSKIATSPQNSLLFAPSAAMAMTCTLDWEKQFDSLLAADATLNFYYQNNLRGSSEAHINMLDGQGRTIGSLTPLPLPGSMNTWVHAKVPILMNSVKFRLTVTFANALPGQLFYVDDFFTVNTVRN